MNTRNPWPIQTRFVAAHVHTPLVLAAMATGYRPLSINSRKELTDSFRKPCSSCTEGTRRIRKRVS
jgi:hypothetical protein